MKNIIPVAIFSIFLLACTACKSKKKATATSTTTTTQQQTTTVITTPPAEDSYRLTVEFYSIGQGIDLKTQEEFEKFLNSYPKKIAYEPTHWGREGEIDYCLKLGELSTSEQADFVKKATEMLSSSTLVHIKENAKCVHKH